jgi:hypothetical protein
MTKPVTIVRSTELPAHLQEELKNLQSALASKYGVAACIAGTALENLTQLCAMIRHTDLTEQQRDAAYVRSREVCADVMNIIGRLLAVEPEPVLAVADSFREFNKLVEEEILGAEVLRETEGAAAAVIAKASATVH